MGVIAIVDTILALMGKINIGLSEAKTFYDAIRAKNPNDNLPELSDAEIILRMRASFSANKESAEAELRRLGDAGIANS